MNACSIRRPRGALNCFKETRGARAEHGSIPAAPTQAPPLAIPPAPPVDLRGLPPPEPLERILDALSGEPAAPLCFLLSMEPLLLYPLLRRERVRWQVRRTEAGVELTVERRAQNL